MTCKCKIQKLYFKYFEDEWYNGRAVFPHTRIYDRIQKRLKCTRKEIYNAVYKLKQTYDIGEITGIITPLKIDSTPDIPCKIRGLNIEHTERQWIIQKKLLQHRDFRRGIEEESK